MDSALPTQSPDSLVDKPSFRKPSNDAVNRKYRRHSPVGGSDSSSSDGSPKHEWNRSPAFSKEERMKMDDQRRKDEGRGVDRDSSRNRFDRSGDSHRHSDRPTYSNHRDYRRHDDDYSRHHRNADEEGRNYQKTVYSGRESRSGNHSDHTRLESYSDRSRDNYRNVDKYSRDKTDSGGHRNRDKEALAYHKHNDKNVSSERVTSGGRRETLYRDDAKSGERDRHRDKGDQDEKREHRRSPGGYKSDIMSSREELKGNSKVSSSGRDDGVTRTKETYISSNKEKDRLEDTHKRKYDSRDRDRCKEKSARDQEEIRIDNKKSYSFHERDEKKEQYVDETTHATEDQSSLKKLKPGHSEKTIAEDGQLFSRSTTVAVNENPLTSSKQAVETIGDVNSQPVGDVNSQPVSSSTGQAEAAHDLNAAKVAAMKAAELVNRNLVGGGYLSTDQKKKLLWGSKKNTHSEESSNRWDVPLFSDRERQEKFNKLMGVKGDGKLEQNPDDKDGSLRAEKQEQLQMDLEKQYTAGLRRRDGRTVGLGL